MPERVTGMQRWEGQVLGVEVDYFTAELVPLDHEGPTVHADFDRSLVAESDRELLAPGAPFYCNVRTVIGDGGQPIRTSTLAMRRLGIWSQQVLDEALRAARERAQALERFSD
ncbi:hypothetical protein [Pedococcus sp. 5OH_020]|uniref:hypothetical protein n=1 Tax=Pedococcus sp. 5OH_020 TaxID=2989814 RepID=UPI0022E9CE2B|nr:hypothetical protein [Pedococcus sp. 5OH_020]